MAVSSRHVKGCLILTMLAQENNLAWLQLLTHLAVPPEKIFTGAVNKFSFQVSQLFVYNHKQRDITSFFLFSVYKSVKEATEKHQEVDVMVNFASLRSAYDVTIETLQFPRIRTIAIIAEGIPENMTRSLIKKAKEKGVYIIGPATVGGIKPGCFKIGNTGGMLDNIIRSKLYRPGSVAYVSRSGGMSNELNNIISLHTNGVYEGVAIGGDRYPGTTFMDHLLRYHVSIHETFISEKFIYIGTLDNIS